MVDTALRHRRTVLAVALVILVAGGWQLRRAKVDALPEFSPPTVQVQTEALGLSAEEVEQYITVPLEQNFLNGIPFLETIQSQSVPGLSSVSLVFEGGTSLATARQLVQERLSLTTELPNVSKPPQMLQSVASTGHVLMIGLSSSSMSALDLSVLARWTVRPRLLSVPGVANVEIWGQQDEQLQVQVDPQRLAQAGVALDQVIETSGDALFVSPLTFLEASTPGNGGFIDTPSQRLSVQHILPIRTPADLAQVDITDTSPPIRIGDVASVVQDHQPLIGDAVLQHAPGLLLVVDRLPGANTRDVTRRLDAALTALRPGLTGVTVDPSIYRPDYYITGAVRHIRGTAIVGVVLLLGVLVVGARGRRALGPIVAVAVAVVAAAALLSAVGAVINAMTMAGLALGVVPISFDALVMHSRGPAALRPLAYGTAAIGVGLVPFLFLSGLAVHPFLPPLVLAYGLAAGLSLVACATLGVVLAAPLPPPAPVVPPAVVIGLCGAIVAAGVFAAVRVTPAMTPALKETEALVQVDAPPGTSLPEMDRVVARMAGELRALPGVRDVGAHVGRAVTSDQIVGTSSGQIWVNFGRSSAKTLHAVQRVVAGYPGVGTKVESYFNQRITDGEEAAGPPVVVRLSGEDYGTLHAKADQIVGVLSRVKGIVHPTVEAQPMQPVIDVQVNIDAAERVGIKPGDIRRAASALLAGIEVGSLYQDQKVFQVEVLGTSATRQSLNAVQDLLLDTPSGGHVRLGDVASVRIQPGLTTIKHTDVTRTLDVTAQVHGRTTGAVLHDVAKQVAGVAFPLNYHANVLGHEENQTAAYHRVLLAALAAAVLLLLLLQAAAESWSAAACLLVLVSAGVGAGLFAAWLDTGTVGVGAVAGLLAVGGVSVKQSLLAIEGRRAGVWPALATLPIFVAVMFAGDVAGTEILRPMAPVVILGVVASTVASLLAPPIVERWVRHA